MQPTLSRKTRPKAHTPRYVASLVVLILVLICLLLIEQAGIADGSASEPGTERAQPGVDQKGSPVLLNIFSPRRDSCQPGSINETADDPLDQLLLDLCETEFED